MGKKLSEMSLEELWQLFPIILTEHQDTWRAWYADEHMHLQAILPQAVRISHIGSTAIRGIWAKPIVDILIELPKGAELSRVKAILTSNRYICMSQSCGRLSLNKGYTENGFAERVFHLHVRFAGDNNELYFRDYLNEHPHIAAEYERLKMKLWKEYEHDRDGYTEQKTAFVAKYTDEAKCLYGCRY